MSGKRIEYKPDPSKFDLMVHRWDSQGNLIRANHYRSFIVDHSRYYERPINSGNLWSEANQPCGRVEYILDDETGKIADKVFNFKAEHKDYVAPATGAALVALERDQAKAALAAAQAELAAIKGERQPDDTPEAKAAPTLTKRR